jgi:hypothetical protein
VVAGELVSELSLQMAESESEDDMPRNDSNANMRKPLLTPI